MAAFHYSVAPNCLNARFIAVILTGYKLLTFLPNSSPISLRARIFIIHAAYFSRSRSILYIRVSVYGSVTRELSRFSNLLRPSLSRVLYIQTSTDILRIDDIYLRYRNVRVTARIRHKFIYPRNSSTSARGSRNCIIPSDSRSYLT